MDARCRIELLGGLRATQGDRTITRFRTQKTGALLAYLAYHRNRSHPRELLIEILWPEADLASGRNNLSLALSSLRRQFEPPGVPAGAILTTDRANVALNPALVTTDAAEFEALVNAAGSEDGPERLQALAEAAALYRGPLLPGYYEEWIEPERARLAEAYLAALRALARHHAQARDFPRALDYARRAVAADPLREEAHRSVMRLLAAAGQLSAALAQYRELEAVLRRELDRGPSERTRQLAREIEEAAGKGAPVRRQPAGAATTRLGALEASQRSGSDGAPVPGAPVTPSPCPAALVPSTAPRDATATRGAWTLPLQLTRFFGRETELERLADLLHPGRQGSSGAEVQGPRGAEGQEDPRRQGSKGAREQGRTGPEPPCAPVPLLPRSLAAPDETRLVTLTGPGGTGKTRLAVEAARRLLNRFSGAVWFVPLADVSDARLLPEAIGDALRLPRSPGTDPFDLATEILARQPSLLVMDNLEQVIEEAAPFLQRLIERVPTLTCLVTSRQRLDLSAESEYSVTPLPTPRGIDTPERLVEFDSVRLFVDRAQAVRPDFQVTNQNAPAVAELCDRLEGIPLAIELAAARAQVLSPAQMVQQLSPLRRPTSWVPREGQGEGSRRFDFLVSRRRDAVERHRTLRATLDWSYRLLSPDLQRMFARLSVFQGGWSLAAAEAVCDEPAALDRLEELRACSLVLAGEDGTAREGQVRFRMLDTLSEYAAGQLSPPDLADARRRHLGYFLLLAEEAEPQLHGPRQGEWLDRLETERANFRAALEWASRQSGAHTEGGSGSRQDAVPDGRMTTGARRSRDTELPTAGPTFGVCPRLPTGLRLAAALWRFWSLRGHLVEGRQLLEELLSRVPADDPELGRSSLRARALHGAGALAHDQSDYDRALVCFAESLELWRAIAGASGSAEGLASCLNSMANVLLDQGENVRAAALYEQALALYREQDDPRGTAMVLSNLGALAQDAGDYDRAAALLTESLRLKRRLGNEYSLAIALDNLGSVDRSRGRTARAAVFYEEALALRRRLGHRQGTAISLNNLGSVLLLEGKLAEAKRGLEESLELLRELGEARGLAECLATLAGVAAVEGEHEQAARLAGAAAALREMHSLTVSEEERGREETWLSPARAALGEEAFAAAHARGEVLPLEAVVGDRVLTGGPG